VFRPYLRYFVTVLLLAIVGFCVFLLMFAVCLSREIGLSLA